MAVQKTYQITTPNGNIGGAFQNRKAAASAAATLRKSPSSASSPTSPGPNVRLVSVKVVKTQR